VRLSSPLRVHLLFFRVFASYCIASKAGVMGLGLECGGPERRGTCLRVPREPPQSRSHVASSALHFSCLETWDLPVESVTPVPQILALLAAASGSSFLTSPHSCRQSAGRRRPRSRARIARRATVNRKLAAAQFRSRHFYKDSIAHAAFRALHRVRKIF